MTTAIITGGSRGLGRALAEALAGRGWDVIIDGRNPEDLAAAAAAMGPRAVPVVGDVADAAHRAALVEAASRTGRLDLLVNNASTLGPSPLPRLRDLDLDALHDVYRVNTLAPLGLVQAALPLLERTSGAVLDITSDAAVEPYEGWGGYGSSKAALEQWSAVLAEEEPQLRVWWLDPGDMRTRMHQDAFPGEDISDRPEAASVVPGILRLLDEELPSGRIRAADLVAVAT